MSGNGQLGDYLRARRELVRPADVGLPVVGQRRVSGLRREEVAMLAGISSDYYLRLEQGRDHNPSVQVLESLGAYCNLTRRPRHISSDSLRPRHVSARDVTAARRCPRESANYLPPSECRPS
ncbi:helix-turn-helix transcriptional regulator [Williamsia sp. D3]|uniref:helix-turn-helix domain-containing protein n=1 Tax=Williamsia sp. D3 TaxID=1313067 RepID=UPI001F341782|nr:helix-turn-helix transcriptional regulator [Williamsia sp. D3]